METFLHNNSSQPDILTNASSLYIHTTGRSQEVISDILEAMNKYIIPIIVLVGAFGNTLSVVVFLGTHMRHMSLSIYLSALAISDTGYLFTVLVTWLDVLDVTIFHTNGMCQLTVYMAYVCSFLSAWFVLSFTVERYIAVYFPFQRPHMCTAYRAKIVTSSLSATALLGYSCTLFANGVRNLDSYILCVPLKKFMHMMSILTHVDTLIALVIPFFIILALNCKIALKVSYFYRKEKRFSINNETIRVNRHSSMSTATLSNRAQLSVTKLMLTISTVFLVINSPSYVFRTRVVILSLTHKNYAVTMNELLWQSICQFLYYINFSINFFIYSICCRKFRGATRRLFRQVRQKASVLSERYLRIGRNSNESHNNIQIIG